MESKIPGLSVVINDYVTGFKFIIITELILLIMFIIIFLYIKKTKENIKKVFKDYLFMVRLSILFIVSWVWITTILIGPCTILGIIEYYIKN